MVKLTMDNLVYKKPRKPSLLSHDLRSGSFAQIDSAALADLPTLAQLQEKQEKELIEIAQVRFGIKGGGVNINLTPLQFKTTMSEAEVFKVLLGAPEHERADQVLYGLAKGDLVGSMANKILASLELLSKFKKIKID
jgi:hypothetical protein